jgi:ArsR family transcriptional regulator
MQTATECCQPLLDEPLSPPDADRLATWFHVLGDPTRLRLLSLIAAKGEACAACDFVDALDVSQPTVSHHLRTLHETGFVEREKRGRWVYYRVRADQLNALSQTLASASQ